MPGTNGHTTGSDSPTHLPLRRSDDIQGDILAGFRKDHQCLLMIGFEDTGMARRWLEVILPEIATTRAVAEYNSAFSAMRRKLKGADPAGLSAHWTGLSVTYPGLVLLAGATPFPTAVSRPPSFQAFREGPAVRAWQVGDIGAGSPAHWQFGAARNPVVHAVLTLASDDPRRLAAAVARHGSLIAAHEATVVFRQDGATLPGGLRGHDHFGFADGVSQPGVRGFDEPDPADPETVLGKPGTGILPASRFVIGVDEPAEALPRWSIGGSFQVIRRLAQDVAGWHAQFGPQLAALKHSGAAPDSADDGWLAARLVGRWPSGTPIARCPGADVPPASGELLGNDLGHADGPNGVRTPRFSHLRKTSPRDDQSFLPQKDPAASFAGSDPRRIIRRGIPFGPVFDPRSADPSHGPDTPRGLLFICYQSDLVEQFEFLQHLRINNTRFPMRTVGGDRVAGNVSRARFGNPADRAGRSTLLSADSFVRTEGALYAFSPAIPVLRDLAQGNMTDLL
ncbi:Dyp-type peroxidase [Kitasatospora sp. NPDC057904]|uniref:Dyp-type peroxidase n=1 Tax=unclassified Kitasatospora TaxID=2633591 RepID=UPI0036DAC6D6